jgi:hypothetical protein
MSVCLLCTPGAPFDAARPPLLTLAPIIFSIERALFVAPQPPAVPLSAIQTAAAASASSPHPVASHHASQPEEIDVRRKQQQLYVVSS